MLDWQKKIFRKLYNAKCWQECEAIGTLLVGLETDARCLESNLTIFSKIEFTPPYDSNPAFGFLIRRNPHSFTKGHRTHSIQQ